MWEFLGNQFLGFDKRAVFDLLFFFYMAFVTAKEFGFNQGQVITLEAHMQEKRRMEAELQEAALISKAFIPGTAPRWDFCDIAIFHKPLSETSGDWYTFEEGPAGRYAHVLLCDITGHGVQAAIVVSTCRAVLSALIAEHPQAADSPDFVAHYARSLNGILFRQGGGHHVTTLLGLTLDRETGKVHFMAAGHPLPLHYPAAASEGAARAVKPLISRSDPLGVTGEGSYTLSEAQLHAGDEVLVYTDGMPAQTGIKGLRTFLASRPTNAPLVPQSLFEAVCEAERARGRPTADDDVSVIWIRWGAPLQKLEKVASLEGPGEEAKAGSH
jgi:sigma-B regulation protein RsbU (phosphoserine phosphatase)